MTKLGAGLRSRPRGTRYAVKWMTKLGATQWLRGTRYAVKWMTKLGAGLRSGYAVRGTRWIKWLVFKERGKHKLLLLL